MTLDDARLFLETAKVSLTGLWARLEPQQADLTFFTSEAYSAAADLTSKVTDVNQEQLGPSFEFLAKTLVKAIELLFAIVAAITFLSLFLLYTPNKPVRLSVKTISQENATNLTTADLTAADLISIAGAYVSLPSSRPSVDEAARLLFLLMAIEELVVGVLSRYIIFFGIGDFVRERLDHAKNNDPEEDVGHLLTFFDNISSNLDTYIDRLVGEPPLRLSEINQKRKSLEDMAFCDLEEGVAGGGDGEEDVLSRLNDDLGKLKTMNKELRESLGRADERHHALVALKNARPPESLLDDSNKARDQISRLLHLVHARESEARDVLESQRAVRDSARFRALETRQHDLESQLRRLQPTTPSPERRRRLPQLFRPARPLPPLQTPTDTSQAARRSPRGPRRRFLRRRRGGPHSPT